jgi:hypothetical protein
MKTLLRCAVLAVTLSAASAGTLLAQAQESNDHAPRDDRSSWVDVARSFDTGKLAIILIFGSGIIATLGYSAAGIIRAFNGSSENSEELTARIDDLEDRIEQLEARNKTATPQA